MGEQNLSQVALTARVAKVIGRPITRRAVMQKLDGTNEPGIGWIEIYARAFGVSVDQIIT